MKSNLEARSTKGLDARLAKGQDWRSSPFWGCRLEGTSPRGPSSARGVKGTGAWVVQRQAGNLCREPTGKHGIQEALCGKRHKEALKDEFMEQSLFLEWSGGRLSLRSSGGDCSEMAKEALRGAGLQELFPAIPGAFTLQSEL